jgi:CRP-like cAMP-binding protein
MHPLRTYIEHYTATTLSDDAFAHILAEFTPKKFRRRQYLLQEGEVCKYFAFVVQGAFRQYTVDAKGVERILHFATENWWIGDRESFVMLKPSKCNIDALEDSEALLVTNASIQELIRTAPAIATMVREMDQRNFIATERRLHASISYTAEERYNDLLTSHPDYLQRFPNHMVASYLGLSAETFSRVRSKALRSK